MLWIALIRMSVPTVSGAPTAITPETFARLLTKLLISTILVVPFGITISIGFPCSPGNLSKLT